MDLVMIIAALASAQAAQAGSQSEQVRVEIGRANWSALAPLTHRVSMPTVEMVDAVEGVLRARSCPSIQQPASSFDITVNYAIQFEGRTARRVVIEDIGCPAIEQMVDHVVRQLLLGNLVDRPTGSATRWYGSSINFNLDSH